jgi:acetylornithine deacetylase/succinyl-diaminopimelate desuccinylase-like protein
VPPVEPGSVIPDTVDAAIDRALEALDSLASLGEDVEDEWQYVQDLTDTWRGRLEEVASGRGRAALPPDRAAAIVRACDEAGLIDDPHRAIDWLSTFPQVVLSTLDERP